MKDRSEKRSEEQRIQKYKTTRRRDGQNKMKVRMKRETENKMEILRLSLHGREFEESSSTV
jgi:hypothetical protein